MPMANILFDLFNPEYMARSPVFIAMFAFQVWMFVDAIRRKEWIWAVFIFFFSILSAGLYFFMVYLQQGPISGGAGLKGFELPGSKERRRIKELMGRIHHLDHARDHLDLADIYFSQNRLDKAEGAYREALKRDPQDPDIIAHLGQCLLRLKRPDEAAPLLRQVLAGDPRHDYGHTQMALAECQMALGDTEGAMESWRQVLKHNSYARARVQYAELLHAKGDREAARREFMEVIDDDKFAPTFQKGRDKVWVKRAREGLARG